MITRHIVKSCCQNVSQIFQTDKPIIKSQMQVFRDAGFLVPENFFNAGVFYVQSTGLIATSSFGTTQIHVRCNGSNCEDLLNNFERLLEQAINL